jgi:hypothetical protein
VPILPESAGYAIVLGFGIFFSIFTTTLVRPRCPNRRQRFPKDSERLSHNSQIAFLAFPDHKPSLKVFRAIGERFLAKPLRRMSTRQRVRTQTVFVGATIFFVLCGEDLVRRKKTLPH